MTTHQIAAATSWAILPGPARLGSELPGVMRRIAGAATRQRLCLALSVSGHLTAGQIALLLGMTPAAVTEVVLSAADELTRTQAPDLPDAPRGRSAAARHPDPTTALARTPGWYRSETAVGHSYWDGSSWNPWVPEQSSAPGR